MSIKSVTYWTAECDGACGQTLNDMTGGDYSAWADPGSVHDDLTRSDVWVSDDDLVFCWTEAPRCLCGNIQSPDKDDPLCEDCDDEGQVSA